MKESEIEALVTAIHRCNQLRLPVMMFGAGLPKILKTLGEAKSYTERLFLFEKVDALSSDEVCAAVEEPALEFNVHYSSEALLKIIDITGKYPLHYLPYPLPFATTECKRYRQEDIDFSTCYR